MSGVPLSTAKPPYAVVAWVDDYNVFVELPSVEGPPYILSYQLSEGGLAQALKVMRTAYEAVKPKPSRGKFSPTAPVREPTVIKDFSKTQRAVVREILKKQGLI